MKFKDVAHLYIGSCKVVQDTSKWFEPIGTRVVDFVGLRDSGEWLNYQFKNGATDTDGCFEIDNFKPILRPLSDMTDQEKHNAVHPMVYGLKSLIGEEMLRQSAEITRFLLSKGFDLFGLIESGEAVSDHTGGEQKRR